MAMNFGKQAQVSAGFDGKYERLVTKDKEEYKKLMRQLEEDFKNRVCESILSLASDSQEEKQEELRATVLRALSSSRPKLPPPPALYQLMAGDHYRELREYVIAAFFRAHILRQLNLDEFNDLDQLDLFKSDWGLQDGEGLRLATTGPSPAPLPVPPQARGPRPLRPFSQVPPQVQGFVPRGGGGGGGPQVRPPFLSQLPPQTQEFIPPGSGIDEFLAQPFPSHEIPPEGLFPPPMPPITPTAFPFQVTPQPRGFMPIVGGGGGGNVFPGGEQFPFVAPPRMQGLMSRGDSELALLSPPPTLEEEFIGRVYELLLLKLPHIPPPVIEELMLIRFRQSPPLPPQEELAKLLEEGPRELELYLINIFIEAYILQELNRLPKIRPNSDYLELERAALAGKWEDAKRFLEKQDDGGRAAAEARVITPYKMTTLHIAAFKGHAAFVKNMVEFLSKIDMVDVLAMEDDRGFTVLDYVALNGRQEVAEALIETKRDLLSSSVSGQLKPSALSIAVLGTCFGNKSDSTRVLRYLASAATDQSLLSEDLINALVLNGHLDILLYLLEGFPDYLKDTSNAASILMILAQTPSNFFSGSDLGFWQTCIYPYIPVRKSYKPSNNMGAKNRVQWFWKLVIKIFSRMKPSCISQIQVSKQKHLCAVAIVDLVWQRILEKDNGVEECFSKQPEILVVAIKFGIIEILRTTFQRCPELVWIRLRCFLQRNSFLKAAIKYRQEEIFKFLMEDKTCFITESIYTGTSMLHRAAKLPPYLGLSCVSGAAFQMQREMQWFKAMEQFVPPTFRYRRENGLTAEELFDMEHKELATTGETWMKDTSNYCMIVSTLITTVVFASAFTVPGGNTAEGSPIFLWSQAFLVFAVSNALALFSSLMSLLMFLSILTARFTAEDFLKSLPKRMILGLASLFFAIATMIIAFGAALAIVLGRRLEWVSIPIILLAAFPVSIFGVLQLPLFIQMIKSTYWSTLSTSKSWD